MEFVIHTYASVDEYGLTVVSPEVIANLLSEVIANDHQGEYTEGDFGLTVKYADLKTLIEMAGHTVKEIGLTRPAEPALGESRDDDFGATVSDEGEGYPCSIDGKPCPCGFDSEDCR